MKRKADTRATFEPQLALRPVTSGTPTTRTWFPSHDSAPLTLDVSRWRTRGARGFSWHSSEPAGNAVPRRRIH